MLETTKEKIKRSLRDGITINDLKAVVNQIKDEYSEVSSICE